MADETIRSNFDKFKKDAIQLAAEFTPEELALYVLTLTVQDPESLPEVEIAREKPLPFKFAPGQPRVKVDVEVATVIAEDAVVIVTTATVAMTSSSAITAVKTTKNHQRTSSERKQAL